MAVQKRKPVHKSPKRKPAAKKAAAPPSKPPRKAPAPPAAPAPGGGDYEKYKERQASISRQRSASGREIGPLPAVGDPERRERCRLDLRLFCETYLSGTFAWAWSDDHLTAIAILQSCILTGGQFAFAMPRGSGKTALCEAAAEWAVLYGHRQFVVIVGATDEAAKESLASVKTDFETNDLIAEDFREVCHPVACLEGQNNRANGQTLDGRRTRITWKDDRVALPTVAGSPSSGSRIWAAGLTGRIRGMRAKTVDGRTIRPDLALVDDPQTDESAASLAQSRKREQLLNRAVLGLAGARTKIAAFVPCTVIAPDDMADRVLDRDRNPVWQGQRTRMVVEWSENTALWDEYAELRRSGQKAGDKNAKVATEFYAARRAAMDAGMLVSWPERYSRETELSAVQHAWNLRIDRGEAAFNAEYQNDPDPPDLGQLEELHADAIAAKLNYCPRGEVPSEVTRLTAFIDVGGQILFWCVCGWTENFSGHVIDYGTHPKQTRSYYAASDARPSLGDFHPNEKEEARIYKGLVPLARSICDHVYPRVGGGESRVERCLIDSGKWTKTITEVCRQVKGVTLPSKGWGIGSGRTPMVHWHVKPEKGEWKGDHFVLRQNTDGGYGQLLIYDVNHWKSFVARALLTPVMGAGCLRLFGDRPDAHQLFADHLTAEYRTASFRQKAGDQSEQEVWSVRPERRDNHWWDCLVGCAVAASHVGVTWSAAAAAGDPIPPRSARRKVKLSEVYQAKHGGTSGTA